MLDGKVAIVTGAARGIGRAFVETLARASAKVIAADVSDCEETVKIGGPNTVAVKADVGDTRSAQAMANAAVERFGRLDILVNNAALYGALHGGRFDKIDEAEWDAAMRVNVKGIWLACKAAVPHMRKVGGGSIVNMASLAALYGTPFALHYTVSKAAVVGMTRALARELGRDNIRVNAIAPSAVLTEGTRQFSATNTTALWKRSPPASRSSAISSRPTLPAPWCGSPRTSRPSQPARRLPWTAAR